MARRRKRSAASVKFLHQGRQNFWRRAAARHALFRKTSKRSLRAQAAFARGKRGGGVESHRRGAKKRRRIHGRFA